MSVIERAIALQKELDDLSKIFTKLKEQMKKDNVDNRIDNILEYYNGLGKLFAWADQPQYCTDISSSLRNLEVTRYNPVRELDKNQIVDDASNGFTVYKKQISELLNRLTESIEKARELTGRAGEAISLTYPDGVPDTEWEDVYRISEIVGMELEKIRRQAKDFLGKMEKIPDLERREKGLIHRYMREITHSLGFNGKIIGTSEPGRYQTDAQIRYMKEIEKFTSGRISSEIFLKRDYWIKQRLEALGVEQKETDLNNFDLDDDIDMKRALELSTLAHKFPTLFPGWYNKKGEFLWDLYCDKRAKSSKLDRFKTGVERVVKHVKRKVSNNRVSEKNQNDDR